MTNTEWQLTGSIAARYEEFMVPVIFAPWAEDLLPRAGLSPGDRLLDLACGTGIVARTAGARGILATGCDLNAGMLAVARAHPQSAAVAFDEGDAEALPYGDRSFDAVICQQGLQFFSDKPAAARECHRVLAPGGRAVFCTARGVAENPLMHAQIAAFSEHLGEEAARAIRAVCAFPNPDQNLAVFEAAGFAPVTVDHVTLELHATDAIAFIEGLMRGTPVADSIAAAPPDLRAAIRDSLLAGFGDCHEGRALTFPHSSNVVVARRAA